MGKIYYDWLLSLPKGKYSLTQLQEISKHKKPNICSLLKILGVKKRYYVVEKKGRKVCEAVYFWNGGVKDES